MLVWSGCCPFQTEVQIFLSEYHSIFLLFLCLSLSVSLGHTYPLPVTHSPTRGNRLRMAADRVPPQQGVSKLLIVDAEFIAFVSREKELQGDIP